MNGQTTDVYLFVQNTLADWEMGYITAEISSKRWYKYYETGNPKYFYDIQNSLKQ